MEMITKLQEKGKQAAAAQTHKAAETNQVPPTPQEIPPEYTTNHTLAMIEEHLKSTQADSMFDQEEIAVHNKQAFLYAEVSDH